MKVSEPLSIGGMRWCCTSSAKALSILSESRAKVESRKRTIMIREAIVVKVFAAVYL